MNLMICVDGVEYATVPLMDGNDGFNQAAERGALDRAYEAKESNPDSVVTIVINTAEGEPDEPLTDLEFVASSLDLLAILLGHRVGLAHDDLAALHVNELRRRDEQRLLHLLVASSLDLLADLDEGEHTDDERLRALADGLRRGTTTLDRATSDEPIEA